MIEHFVDCTAESQLRLVGEKANLIAGMPPLSLFLPWVAGIISNPPMRMLPGIITG
jgi:hypothetical protein